MVASRWSIVVPVLNEAANIDCIIQALTTVKASVEVIFVDGGSTDSTVAKVAAAGLRCLASNPGRALQMNLGAAAAQGDYLLFLHADTRLPEGWPDLLAELVESGPQWGFFPVRLSGGQSAFRIIEWFMNWRSALTSVATGDQALFVQRSLWLSCNGYKPIPLMEDVELCKRLRRFSSPVIASRPVTTSSRRWLAGGIVKTVALMWVLRLGFWLGVRPARLAKWYR